MEKQDIFITEEVEPPGSLTGHARIDHFINVLPSRHKTARTSKKRLRVVPRTDHSSGRSAAVSKSFSFRRRFFPHATSAEWNDWRWQLRNRISDLDALSRIIKLSEEERKAGAGSRGSLPLAVTPYYASLLDPDDPLQPLRRTVVPVQAESTAAPGEREDPLGEESDSPVPGIVHRYPDRVLFLVTDFCSTYCRYCTRSRLVGHGASYRFGEEQWERALDYIRANAAIRDVLLSGGDPLTLTDEKLEFILARLRRIPHVEFIRIGTKAPVVLPQRITPALARMLKRYHPLWMSIHFTHPEELTPEVSQSCCRLADAGIPLGSQTVLLAGINDSVETMKCLVHGLLRLRVRPYYLYQCDPISGSAHFRTPVKRGLEIIEGLRGHTSGYAVPTYVIDAPGGGGKVPLLPQYLIGKDNGDLLIRNYKGRTYRYPDAEGTAGLNVSAGTVCGDVVQERDPYDGGRDYL
jgi:lysine 2,3-aminomutase